MGADSALMDPVRPVCFLSGRMVWEEDVGRGKTNASSSGQYMAKASVGTPANARLVLEIGVV